MYAPIKHRNAIKCFFITFPKSGNVTKSEFINSLPPLEKYICAKELHQDGLPHFHITCELKTKKTKKQMLDLFEKKYPNDYKRIDVQAKKGNWQQSLDYYKLEYKLKDQDIDIHNVNLKKSKVCLYDLYHEFLSKEKHYQLVEYCVCQECIDKFQNLLNIEKQQNISTFNLNEAILV